MKLLTAALLCAFTLPAFASTPTATLTDTDGTAWANCRYAATLTILGSTSTPAPTVNGVTVSPLTVTGSCDASGAISPTLTDTSTVDQPNAQWVFTIQSNTSAGPVKVSTPVVGSAPNLSKTFSLLPAPRFATGANAYGYNDAEIQGVPQIGSTYYNVTTPCLKQYSLAGWTCGGGGGSITLTTTGTSGVSTLASGALNIPNYTYTLPTASTSILGGVKVDGTTIAISSGVISSVGGGLADPGANGMIYRSALNTTRPATYTDVQTLLSSDTVDNTAVAFSTGSGGDSTIPSPTSGKDFLAMKSGAINYSHNGGPYAPLVTGGSGIANTTVALPTTAIAANACTSPATATMTGLATTSTFTTAFATNPNAVTGWGSSGGLTFTAWPTANTLNWSVCNSTAASITPGAMTLNVGAR